MHGCNRVLSRFKREPDPIDPRSVSIDVLQKQFDYILFLTYRRISGHLDMFLTLDCVKFSSRYGTIMHNYNRKGTTSPRVSLYPTAFRFPAKLDLTRCKVCPIVRLYIIYYRISLWLINGVQNEELAQFRSCCFFMECLESRATGRTRTIHGFSMMLLDFTNQKSRLIEPQKIVGNMKTSSFCILIHLVKKTSTGYSIPRYSATSVCPGASRRQTAVSGDSGRHHPGDAVAVARHSQPRFTNPGAQGARWVDVKKHVDFLWYFNVF